MTSPLDLTKSSLTFPNLPERLIPRDNLVRWLRDRFTTERKIIIVQSPDGAGKTTLLAQFAKSCPDSCFSFFVGSDLWTSSARPFLLEMCTQMQLVVGSGNGEVSDDCNDEDLKQLFYTFYRRAAKKARGRNRPYYFVVDGLDWVKGDYGENSILDLLPTDLPEGLYLLASSTPDLHLDFHFESWPIPFFSLLDAESYLAGSGLTQDEVKHIYSTCEGLPGYLAQILRELQSGLSGKEVLADLPKEFRHLLNREWERAGIENIDILNGVAVLAYAEMPLRLNQLAQIVNAQQENLTAGLASLSMIRTDSDRQVRFITDAHKRFVADKLLSHQGRAEAMLIEYLEQDKFSESAMVQLPILYRKTGSYDHLKHLVNVEYLSRTLQRKRNIDLPRRNVRLVAEAAYEAQDWETLLQYSLMGSILGTLSTRSAAEAEVEALLSLGDYERCIQMAYQAVLPEDRLQLLARAGRYLKETEVPIPGGVLSDLEHMVAEIQPTGVLRERAAEIAADLFYVHSRAAMDLIEKIAGVADGKQMDTILAVLSLRLSNDEGDSSEMLRSRIGDQSLRDFARVSSPLVAKLTPEQLLMEASKIDDTSARLFLLRSWCNANRDSPDAIQVIREALEIMTSSTDYSPSMRHLRQFAEPLDSCEGEEVKLAIERFDLLKDTALEEPAEELVRLELILASVEAHESPEAATDRFCRVYFDLDSISNLDTQCYCLVRMLLSLPQIDPNDHETPKEILKNLSGEYQTLLDGSADHWAITRRLLAALTNRQPEMAVDFAGKLNTVGRRDMAYREILRVYTDREPEHISLDFIDDVLSKISEVERHDWTLLRVLERFSQRDMFRCVPKSERIVQKIAAMQEPGNRSYAYAYASQLMASAGKAESAEALSNKAIESWNKLDPKWKQARVGFDLIPILAKHTLDSARRVLAQVRAERAGNPLAEKTFAKLYVGVVRLAIRAFGDIVKSQDCIPHLERLFESIRLIPSCAVQCQLLADLALIHEASGRHQDFERLVKEGVLKLLESCEDAESRSQTIVEIAPCLFRYERKLMFAEVSQLSISRQNKAFSRAVVHLLTGKLPGDPVDLDSLNVQVEYADACRICELIALVHSDQVVYELIKRLVDALIRRDRDKQEKCVLIEKNALHIAKELSKIVQDKFPDPNNIQHAGYQIVSQAYVARLRASAERRATTQWEKLAPSWQDIAQAARDIPNIADQSLVEAWVGKNMYASEPTLGHRLLEEAKDCVGQIPNLIDRANRLCAIAESWKSVDDIESAKVFLEEAMSILKAWRWDQTRDQITGRILQLAHSVEPEFAASLTSSVDNPVVQYEMKQDLTAYALKRRPEDVTRKVDAAELHDTLGKAAWQLLETFCSGRGYAQQDALVGQWVHLSIDAEFDNAYKVAAWAIENALARTKKLHASTLGDTYRGLLASLELIRLMGETLLLDEANWDQTRSVWSALPPSLALFLGGSQDEATSSLQEWLTENANAYVRIYDAYFTESELDILKYVSSDIRVDILTLWKTQKGISPGDRAIVEQRYRDAWNEISAQRPPEAHIHIVGNSSGDGPIHDRYMITQGKGISLGPSLEGSGRKDTTFHLLDADEAASVEQKFIVPILLGSHREWEGERLIVTTFTL